MHRSGNVHDSNGACEFILQCVRQVRKSLPGVIMEVRMDSVFFNDEIVSALSNEGIEFSISVPFERFTELKVMIENRQRWYSVDKDRDYFEILWKPKSWPNRFRFLFVRARSKQQVAASVGAVEIGISNYYRSLLRYR